MEESKEGGVLVHLHIDSQKQPPDFCDGCEEPSDTD